MVIGSFGPEHFAAQRAHENVLWRQNVEVEDYGRAFRTYLDSFNPSPRSEAEARLRGGFVEVVSELYRIGSDAMISGIPGEDQIRTMPISHLSQKVDGELVSPGGLNVETVNTQLRKFFEGRLPQTYMDKIFDRWVNYIDKIPLRR